MFIALIDDVVRGSHIIYHLNEDSLESERRAINCYPRTTQGRAVLCKLACTGSLMGE